jgi:hypothetical protein
MVQPSGGSRTSVLAARVLFAVNAAFWIVLGLLALLRVADRTSMIWLLAFLMFANAGVMLWLSWALGKQRRLFYYLAIAVLAVNILLSVTDEFGFIDLVALLIDAVLLVVLIASRSQYRSRRQGTGVEPGFSKERQ